MKVFYKEVTVEAVDGGFGVALDGRIIKTPGKDTLVMLTSVLAEAVAEEWRAQSDEVDASTMPITKLANTALDRVAKRMDDVAAEIANFGGTDLLCYRADEPEELIKRQNEIWNPYLEWAKDVLHADLKTTDGIMPVAQDEAALNQLTVQVIACDPFELTALHEFTNGFGSLVLALAYMQGHKPFDELWAASLLDLTYQEEQWGLDYEVEDKRKEKLADLEATCRFLKLVRDN
ncbi:hypothetical protein KFE96_08905 [Kordiimonas sp. SCSIO 12603]|uniref:ATP12 family chaperone protein n=1 Tax=Kordiimonas sp. SCSIO 12603 TaxID=2829596 RepID=UPI002102CD8C|nr:ATP12 family protein [Kordiimonas sp. SCSIO 12603]UTW56988.1 hypothetical protein KFE96_08905 [Kordiimonas sp. SCSIO 12603]